MSSPEANRSFAPDACAVLVTKAEIEQAVNAKVGPIQVNGKSDAPIGIPPYGGSLCYYPIEAGGFVQITVGSGPDAASVESAYASYKTHYPGSEVAGLGAAAHSSDSSLAVVDGPRLVTVTVFSTTLDTPTTDAAQVALAEKVLGRW
jgi:hypothetical protein